MTTYCLAPRPVHKYKWKLDECGQASTISAHKIQAGPKMDLLQTLLFRYSNDAASCTLQECQYKKLSYCRGTVRCVVSVEILPIAAQQCRNYLYDKSWSRRVKVGRCVINMCTQPWRIRDSSCFHCLIGVINKMTTVELCISPVYRRLAVAKFSKSTM